MKAVRAVGVRRFIFLLAAGAVLLICSAPSEYLFVPQAIETPARFVYRIAYFFVLPCRVLITPVLPQVNHQWPVAHTVVVCLGTPFLFLGFWKIYWRVARGRPKVEKETKEATGGHRVSRREFVVTSMTGVGGAVLGGAGFYGALVEPQRLQVRHYTLPIRGLPPRLDGLRLVHVADTHYGPFVSLSYLEAAVAQVNALEGDVVLLTGDYVHRSRKAIEPGIDIFGRLEARFGAVAVMGNHEHWEGVERCREVFKRIGIPTIDNGRVFLGGEGFHDDAERPDSICIAGVGDLWEGEVSFEKAFADVAETMPRLLLSHNPDVAEILDPAHRVDAMFSGHTHGGQIRWPLVGPYTISTEYGQKYLGGLCIGPYCPVIVSRGVGLAGVPIRLGVPPEIGVIRLESA